jgi:hypothetical protein
VVILLWLLACGKVEFGGVNDGANECSDNEVTAECGSAETRGACLREGGCWGAIGVYSDTPECNCPTTDAGAPCTDGDECEGSCIAEDCSVGEGTCSPMMIWHGCNCYLPDTGMLCME